jgi:hypothetical protein
MAARMGSITAKYLKVYRFTSMKIKFNSIMPKTTAPMRLTSNLPHHFACPGEAVFALLLFSL